MIDLVIDFDKEEDKKKLLGYNEMAHLLDKKYVVIELIGR